MEEGMLEIAAILGGAFIGIVIGEIITIILFRIMGFYPAW